MKMTNDLKLKMVKERLEENYSLSHLSERYQNYHVARIKYLVKLYKKHGEAPFLTRERNIYKRELKLMAIGRVEAGESIREVGIDIGLIDPGILSDWVKKYRTEGEEGVQDTHPRANYLLKNERYKAVVDQKIAEENERLRAEIAYLKKSQSLVKKLEGATVQEKVRIVQELRTSYRLSFLLEITDLASSVYYYHLQVQRKRINKYEALEQEIERLFVKKHKKRSGYQRIYIELKKNGWCVGKNKVLAIMQQKKFVRVRKPKWRKYSSYEGDIGRNIPNVMNQDFTTNRPYQKAGTDVTEFPMSESSIYLSPVIDFDSREVLAYVIGKDAKVDRIMGMLKQLKKKHGENIRGMMIQSDQGIQYQNSRYSNRLKQYGIVQSMSRKGNCLDNSPTENFFGRLKQEIWDDQRQQYLTEESLIETIHEYIRYYNRDRIVMKTKMTPEEYRSQYLSRQQ